MPQILDMEVGPGCRLGVWKITEDPDELKWKLQWSAEDIRKFKSHNDGERSKHWLYSRILLREMLNTTQFIELDADEYGKPFLVNFPQKLSISHSGDMVAVLLSTGDCGMDIQFMKPNIEKVAHKFINTAEWENITEDENRIPLMYLVWGCKEALYKYYGRKSLAFKENLSLSPFIWKPEGITRGQIEKNTYFKDLPVHWMTIEDEYLLAWTMDN